MLFLLSIFLIACGNKEKTEQVASKKDTLVYAQISEGKTLDPQDTTEQYSQRIVTLVYSRLAEINRENGEIEPELAESWERPNANEIIFKLEKMLNFQWL